MLRRGSSQASTKDSNRSDEEQENNKGHEEDEEDESRLLKDIYTFITYSEELSRYYMIAWMTFGLQISIFGFFIQSKLKNPVPGNYFKIPLRVSATVNLCQGGALIVTWLDNAEDLTKVANVVMGPGTVRERMKHIMSNVLRLIVVSMTLTVSLLVIVQSSDVVLLFLNFIAVSFVGKIDINIYELVERGVFGEDLSDELRRIKKKIKKDDREAKKNIKGRAPWRKGIFLIMVFLGLLGFWCVAKWTQYSNAMQGMICQNFDLNIEHKSDFRFFDKVLPNRNFSVLDKIDYTDWKSDYQSKKILDYREFNGLYTSLDDNNEIRTMTRNRPTYYHEGRSSHDTLAPDAKISYCRSSRRWVFTIPGITKEFDSDEDGCNWLMRSKWTRAFSLDEVSMVGWDIWSGPYTGLIETIDDSNFLSCAQCEDETDCNYHGTCKHDYGFKKKCECKKPWSGVKCDTCSDCDKLTVKNIDIGKNIEMSIKDEDVKVYGRSVYVALYEGFRYVLLHTGARFIIGTFDDTMVGSNETFLDAFLTNYQSTWNYDGFIIKFESKLTMLGSPTKELKWNEMGCSSADEVTGSLNCTTSLITTDCAPNTLSCS